MAELERGQQGPPKDPLVRSGRGETSRALQLAAQFFRRDLAEDRRGSALGLSLTLVPLLISCTWAFALQEARVFNADGLSIPYMVFVVIGLMVWTTFIDALRGPIVALPNEARLLALSNAPPAAIVLARAARVAFDFAIKLVLIFGFMLWFGIEPSLGAPLALLPLLLVIVQGTAYGLILAPLNVFFDDVSKLLPAVTLGWMFLTPVLVVSPTDGFMAAVFRWNPVTAPLDAVRDLLVEGSVRDPVGLGVSTFVTLVVLAVGWATYRVFLPLVAERTNA